MGMGGLESIFGGVLELFGKCSLVRVMRVSSMLSVSEPSGFLTCPIELELIFLWTILESKAADFCVLEPEIKFFQLSLLAFLQFFQ